MKEFQAQPRVDNWINLLDKDDEDLKANPTTYDFEYLDK